MSVATFPAAFMAQPSRLDSRGWYVETRIHAVDPGHATYRQAISGRVIPVHAVALCGRSGEITTSYDPAKLDGLARHPSIHGFCAHCARRVPVQAER